MSCKNSVAAITLESLDTSTLSGAYKPISAAGLPQACFLLRITNAATKALTISFDGVTDHEYIPSGTSITLEVQTNNQPNNRVALWAKNQVIYVNGTASTGNVYVSGYYQPVVN